MAHRDADAIFSVLDVNGDNLVSQQELSQHLLRAGYTEQAIARIFETLDTDKSGYLSREELREGFVTYSPLRQAPGLGSYNSKFVAQIHAEADILFASVSSRSGGSLGQEPSEESEEYLSETEMRIYLRKVGYGDDAITTIYNMLDADSNGELSREELRDAFVRYAAVRLALGNKGWTPSDSAAAPSAGD